MTEGEAKTKACFRANSFCASKHFDRDNFEPPLCIGSACMAWRWEKVPNPEWKDDHLSSTALYPRPNPYAADPAYVLSVTHGRCGLAGQQ